MDPVVIDEIPDVFVDDYQIAPGRYGVALMLRRTDPANEPGTQKKSNLVVILRMAPAFAGELSHALLRAQTSFVSPSGEDKAEP